MIVGLLWNDISMQLDIHIKRLSVVKLMTKIKIEVGQIYHKNGLLGELI